MSKKQQIEKNLELSAKLASFLAKHPHLEDGLPHTASYVFFSATDEQLNQTNLKLASSLALEGKTVIKAIETQDKKHPWQLIPLVQ